MFRDELGVLTQAVAGALDLDDHGVVQEAVEERGGEAVLRNLQARYGSRDLASGAGMAQSCGSEVRIRGIRRVFWRA